MGIAELFTKVISDSLCKVKTNDTKLFTESRRRFIRARVWGFTVRRLHSAVIKGQSALWEIQDTVFYERR